LLFALLWALLDALRSQTPLAHSWGALAYTQWRDLPLWQVAIPVGQLGLTFLCAWFAASLALWARRGHFVLWFAPLMVFALLHNWGAWRLQKSTDVGQNASGSLRVLLVQTKRTEPAQKRRRRRNRPFREAYILTREATDTGTTAGAMTPLCRYRGAERNAENLRCDRMAGTTVDLAGSGGVNGSAPATGQLRALKELES
jgi:apolipoprotein N-acyltransferase